jgi:hypothetical protein
VSLHPTWAQRPIPHRPESARLEQPRGFADCRPPLPPRGCRRPSPVAGDEPEEYLCSGVVEWGESEFVEDDRADAQQGFDDLQTVLSAKPR